MACMNFWTLCENMERNLGRGAVMNPSITVAVWRFTPVSAADRSASSLLLQE